MVQVDKMAPTIVLAPGRLADASSQVGTGLTVNSQRDWSYRVSLLRSQMTEQEQQKRHQRSPSF